jgi:thiol:disulfide interchange protein DsbD
MKRFLAVLVLIGLCASVNAQIYDPVKWEYTQKAISNTEVELQFTATMEEHWHIYGVYLPEEATPLPTAFLFTETDDYCLIGKLKEPKPIKEFDPNFEEELQYHEGTVTFKQRIKVNTSKDFILKAERSFMVCNEFTCLPPDYYDVEFEIKGAPTDGTCEDKKEEPKVVEIEPSNESKPNDATTEPVVEEVASGVDEEKLEIDYAKENESASTKSKEESDVAKAESPKEKKSKSVWAVFIFGFLGGFAALLTPCVFPMIPLTVSFFTKRSKTKAKGMANALIYGVSIIGLYTGLGYFITVVFGSDALNAFSTNPYVNIAFFVLLVVFAISFFGAFEITLPSSWVNKADQASDKGGLLGIFFMAFTLALVSFSCTGPIIGTLLVEASRGGIQGPLMGMFGFSLALALPFALFAAFPGWLNSLPKSGGWLNSVKVVLGFIELAFAFKFLSTADLVWQAGILPREWFIAAWIAIFTLLTLYLLGKFRMPHDSPMDKLSVPRLLFATLTLMFTIYLVPGMWGAPLKLISGFPPPMFYSESPNGIGGGNSLAALPGQEIPEGADPEHCPHQLNCFHDFDEGLAHAKKVNKPVMLDFTGWGCVNCRKMEEQVWSDPRVLEILREDVVLISLYVDERERLAEEEQFVSDLTGKKIKTIGNKWSEFQIRHFASNAQPQYIILDHQSMEPLNGTTAYDPDIDYYIEWLNNGVKAFKEK